jgi:hypothetical protein
MQTDLAELSSIASSIEQLTGRLSTIAERASSFKEERVSTELFAVERALQGAGRRLSRLIVAIT